jgi:regulator of chromosome condensation
MAPRSANIGKKRAADNVDPTGKVETRPSRAKSVPQPTAAVTKTTAAKRSAEEVPESSKPATSKRQRPARDTASKKTNGKRVADEEPDASKPAKRLRPTKEPARPTTKKAAIERKKRATKSTTTKKQTTKTTTAKPTKVEKPKVVKNPVVLKKPQAKKSLVESRKAEPEPEINTIPTDKLAIFACGEGTAGELGLGPKGTEVKRPRLNKLLNKDTVGIVSISAGGMHVVALTHDNKILTWGVNDNQALGRDSSAEEKLRDADASDSDSDSDDGLNAAESTPLPVQSKYFPEGTKFCQVAAGDSASFVLTTTGVVYGWGTFRVSLCFLMLQLNNANITCRMQMECLALH